MKDIEKYNRYKRILNNIQSGVSNEIEKDIDYRPKITKKVKKLIELNEIGLKIIAGNFGEGKTSTLNMIETELYKKGLPISLFTLNANKPIYIGSLLGFLLTNIKIEGKSFTEVLINLAINYSVELKTSQSSLIIEILKKFDILYKEKIENISIIENDDERNQELLNLEKGKENFLINMNTHIYNYFAENKVQGLWNIGRKIFKSDYDASLHKIQKYNTSITDEIINIFLDFIEIFYKQNLKITFIIDEYELIEDFRTQKSKEIFLSIIRRLVDITSEGKLNLIIGTTPQGLHVTEVHYRALYERIFISEDMASLSSVNWYLYKYIDRDAIITGFQAINKMVSYVHKIEDDEEINEEVLIKLKLYEEDILTPILLHHISIRELNKSYLNILEKAIEDISFLETIFENNDDYEKELPKDNHEDFDEIEESFYDIEEDKKNASKEVSFLENILMKLSKKKNV